MNKSDTILKSMARTLWVCAWADFQDSDEGEGYPAGSQLMDIAPETPEAAYFEAARLMGQYEALNRAHIYVLVSAAWNADSPNNNYVSSADDEYIESFGHYLVMMALGHGVSWFDDHAKFDLKKPFYFEVDYHELVAE